MLKGKGYQKQSTETGSGAAAWASYTILFEVRRRINKKGRRGEEELQKMRIEELGLEWFILAFNNSMINNFLSH